MQNEKLENQIEFLLSAALQKCGNIHDAEDLAQETLFCALSYMAKGNRINDLRAWLLTVLNHKWNDHLRKKYRQPTVGIGQGFDIADEYEFISDLEKNEEAQNLRKSIAYLAGIYREVTVRHYMNGESIAAIALSLGVPEGTVKRRLHTAREQMKKGITQMENYSRQSYQPVSLSVSNSGNNGRNNEPWSLVHGDLLTQNILWIAYEKPIAADAIAKTIGVPTAYIEPVLVKLVDGELMKKTGNRYYTDFMITTVEDKAKYIPEQKRFAKDNFDLIWNTIGKGLEQLRAEEFYKRCTFDEKNSLEMYFVFNCLDYGLYRTFCEIVGEKQNFPYRKDGGRWIAFGNVSFGDENDLELLMHSYSGERFIVYENFAASKILRQHVYSADGFPNLSYYRSPDYDFLKQSDNIDDIITRLLYIIQTGTDAESLGFDAEYLKAIPWLTKCKILRTENGKPQVNIPVINETEFNRLCELMNSAKIGMWDNEEFKNVFSAFLKGKEQKVPEHLDSVPVHKRYMYADNAILFATLREAMKRGELYDGNYDDDSNAINQHPCPMILVIE